LLIAAIAAAAMSSVDSSLNSSATIVLSDIYKRYLRPQAGEKESMRVLYATTLIWGILGTAMALAMKLAGIFSGGMLGLFLLGLISRRANNTAAATGVALGILVILWMTFSPNLTGTWAFLKSPFHSFMIIVVGTLTILLVGIILSWFTQKTPNKKKAMEDGD